MPGRLYESVRASNSSFPDAVNGKIKRLEGLNMKQLGNLAVICAQRPDMLMQLHGGEVSVHLGAGPQRAAFYAAWDDDERIGNIIYELNYGRYAEKRSA
jgi:hypothetical protein